MNELSQLLAQLETVEFWINLHFRRLHDNWACVTIQNIEGEIRKRHRILKRLLRLQLREYKRD